MKLTAGQIVRVKDLLSKHDNQKIMQLVKSSETADLAGLMTSFNKSQSGEFIDILLILGRASTTLAEMPEPALKELLLHVSDQRLLALFHEGTPEELVYFLDLLEEQTQTELLNKIPLNKKLQVEQFLKYPENSVGRSMQASVFSVPSHFTVSRGIELLKQRAKEEPIYYVYCVNRKNQLVGVVSMRQLAVAEETLPLENLIDKSTINIKAKATLQEAAQTVAHYNFLAIPVINEQQELIGLITKDEVIDLMQEQATADLYARAGLEEDDRIFTPISTSIKYRLPWMGLNLLLAVAVSSVVSLFEQTMSRLIILATLKNIVTGIGGNTAIQTLTVITRGLAIGDFRFISLKKALIKELVVGAVLGITTGLGAALITYFWRGSILVSIVIFIAMLLNSLMAVVAGACIPIFLKRFRRDPAIGSGVLVTAITDIFGFFFFLGIAALGLKLMGGTL